MRTTNNSFILKGFVGQTPELRETSNGTKVLNLSLAENIELKDGTTKVLWHRVVCWESVAEHAAAKIEKGMLLRVEGRNVPRTLEIEGKKYSTNELTVSYIEEIVKAEKSESILEEPPMSDEVHYA